MDHSKIHPVKSQIVVDDLHIKSIMSDQGLAINVSHDVNHDEAMIMAMGYKAEFKREFSPLGQCFQWHFRY